MADHLCPTVRRPTEAAATDESTLRAGRPSTSASIYLELYWLFMKPVKAGIQLCSLVSSLVAAQASASARTPTHAGITQGGGP